MDLDLFDIKFRLEARRGIKIPRAFWDAVWNRDKRDARVGDIYESLCQLAANPQAHGRICWSCKYDLTRNISGVCPECGETIPDPRDPQSIWDTLRICIADVVGMPQEKILPDSWLIKDLGASV